MHQIGIVHLDLSTEHVMLDDDGVITSCHHRLQLRTLCGYPHMWQVPAGHPWPPRARGSGRLVHPTRGHARNGRLLLRSAHRSGRGAAAGRSRRPTPARRPRRVHGARRSPAVDLCRLSARRPHRAARHEDVGRRRRRRLCTAQVREQIRGPAAPRRRSRHIRRAVFRRVWKHRTAHSLHVRCW